MFVTDKIKYFPVEINSREVLDVKEVSEGTEIKMKDASTCLVDESVQHVKSLMLVELTSNVMGNR